MKGCQKDRPFGNLHSPLGIMAIPFAIYAGVFLLCAFFLSLMERRNEREEGGSL